jgi:hypothetical protein
MVCSVDLTLFLFNCITKTLQVTEGRKYFPQGPYVGQPSFKTYLRYQVSAFRQSLQLFIERNVRYGKSLR